MSITNLLVVFSIKMHHGISVALLTWETSALCPSILPCASADCCPSQANPAVYSTGAEIPSENGYRESEQAWFLKTQFWRADELLACFPPQPHWQVRQHGKGKGAKPRQRLLPLILPVRAQRAIAHFYSHVYRHFQIFYVKLHVHGRAVVKVNRAEHILGWQQVIKLHLKVNFSPTPSHDNHKQHPGVQGNASNELGISVQYKAPTASTVPSDCRGTE